MPKVKDGEGGRVGGTGEYVGRGVGGRVTGGAVGAVRQGNPRSV